MTENNARQQGFFMPAEWCRHEATWLSYPHNRDSWPGKIESIFPSYHLFVKVLAECETVHINVDDAIMQQHVDAALRAIDTDMSHVVFHQFPTNDAWCRDHGPAFLINHDDDRMAVVNWNHNAWGGKYPYNLDTQIPRLVYDYLHHDNPSLSLFEPGIVMEGGSIDVNGCGDLVTTRSCLLNPNRNPHLSQKEIEAYLHDFYGVENVMWLNDGIVGDDTDGHIDDMVRFVSPDTVVAAVEEDLWDENYAPLQENLKLLRQMRLANGSQLNVVELPMPDMVFYDNQRLPASYANFYIANGKVIFPTYRCLTDNEAAYILEALFPYREVVGIDSTDIVWGLGSFHCLSQQQPATGV